MIFMESVRRIFGVKANGRSQMYGLSPIIPADQAISITPLAGTLKTWTDYFDAVWDGSKTFEVRESVDRDFKIGQNWLLLEYNPKWIKFSPSFGVTYSEDGSYSGRGVYVKITYVMRGGRFGLAPGWGIFGFKVLARVEKIPGY